MESDHITDMTEMSLSYSTEGLCEFTSMTETSVNQGMKGEASLEVMCKTEL